MSEESSVGLLFKEALKDFSEKHAADENICGIKLDLRSQGIDLIAGIRFVDGESQFNLCTANTNCEEVDDDVFNLLSDTLKKIGVESKSGAAIMIKRNAKIVTNDEGCQAIEAVKEGPTEDAQKKRSGLFGFFGKK
jgi:ferredoxin